MEEDVNSVNLFVSVNNTVWPVFLERSKMDSARVQQSRRLPFKPASDVCRPALYLDMILEEILQDIV
ncbi:hypothetical protein V1477_002573 [Vespula maculifrons]|uniref:Uncharacterized protein n=1 Tax=Vespula maculifrons TaxID=7453 RepID=A0ABD2CEX8_VESMC